MRSGQRTGGDVASTHFFSWLVPTRLWRLRFNLAGAARTAALIAVGAVFLAAGALKLYQMVAGPGEPLVVTLVGPSGAMLLICVELLLGLLLFAGLARRLTWAAAVVFFCFAALGSLALVLVGRSSCGCFGAVDVHPSWTLALDMVCLGLLWLVRPVPLIHVEYRWPHIAAAIGLVVVTLGTLAWFTVGSGRAWLAAVRGESIVGAEPIVNIGTASTNDIRTVAVVVVNMSDHPVNIIGARRTCNCRAIERLPVVVKPGGKVEIPVRFRFPASAGIMQGTFDLFTDNPAQPVVRLRYVGRVAETGTSNIAASEATLSGQTRPTHGKPSFR